ncbi:hypothetical protein M408DRAFT_24120 [Serendipita vermifera MAFF 305830]|uniref:Uncharacterized protein n=1 Tax=Serendipita vermifera MAFF 305830 TaxID=933852 RepID=A0A0C3B9L4_SERVB|nr:hypothetical protein M408DRAFT_24120 [Serendipita vermifera MAFF 305830]
MSSSSSKTKENKPAASLERTDNNNAGLSSTQFRPALPTPAPDACEQRELASENRTLLGNKNSSSTPTEHPLADPSSFYRHSSPADRQPSIMFLSVVDSATKRQWAYSLDVIEGFKVINLQAVELDPCWSSWANRLNAIKVTKSITATIWGDLDPLLETQKTIGRLLFMQMNEKNIKIEPGSSLFNSLIQYKENSVLGTVAAHVIQGLNLNPRDAPSVEAQIKVDDLNWVKE